MERVIETDTERKQGKTHQETEPEGGAEAERFIRLHDTVSTEQPREVTSVFH